MVQQLDEIPITRQGMAEAAQALQQLHAGEGDAVRSFTLVRSDGSMEERVHVELPQDVTKLLFRILSHLANGDGVVLVRTQHEVTTQQAADMLNVSRPYVVRLIEDGKLPAHKVGTHRRIKIGDVLAYQRQRDAASRAALDELAAEAQELGLGY